MFVRASRSLFDFASSLSCTFVRGSSPTIFFLMLFVIGSIHLFFALPIFCHKEKNFLWWLVLNPYSLFPHARIISIAGLLLLLLVTRPLPRDGGMAENHEAPEAGQLPRVWTRGRTETESRQRVSGAKSP